MRLPAGSVVDIDWSRDVPPKEPNKMRPAVVVEDSRLFSDDFPNVIVVACTRHLDFAIEALCVRMEPDEENGLDDLSYAVAHQITVVSKQRLAKHRGNVTPEILTAIRAAIAETLGLPASDGDLKRTLVSQT